MWLYSLGTGSQRAMTTSLTTQSVLNIDQQFFDNLSIYWGQGQLSP
jgi:hypothetical protein